MPLHLQALLEEVHPPSYIAIALTPHLRRIADMQIVIRSAEGMEFLSLLAGASDPSATYQLRVLNVHYNRETFTSSGGFLRFQENQRALFSRLDLLVLNDVGILGWPDWGVKEIRIHVMDDLGSNMTWYKVFGVLLSGLPLLKELEISTLYDPKTGTPDQVPPSIAKFPSLSMIKARASSSTLRPLLAVFDAPSLTSLEIEWWNSWDDNPFPPVMEDFVRRHPCLQRLMMAGVDDEQLADVLALLPFAPSLETLILDNSQGSGGPILTNALLALPKLPNLRYLKMERMYFSLGQLKALLLNSQQPLSMELDVCFVTTPNGSYPDATNASAAALIEADMETIARDLSERDIRLTWSETAFGFEP
ncbi:hypothetical protein FRC01_002555 [Tulasnella sp. 417]|nr:hypothetical protein FRC01_002555 [Tulasnella sp. 417]